MTGPVSWRRVAVALALVPIAWLAVVIAVAAIPPLRRQAEAIMQRMSGRQTIDERLAGFGAAASGRLAAAGLAAMPQRMLLVAFKDARRLELHADGRFIRAYDILAASGTSGPKLREGDNQVPEGFYAVVSLNPNSMYHVSLRLDYPNAEDRAVAAGEGRTDLGGDIMIHGQDCSVGCLAMGDAAAEELFTLVARIGCANAAVIIAPTDFRRGDIVDPTGPPWLIERYARLRAAVRALGR